MHVDPYGHIGSQKAPYGTSSYTQLVLSPSSTSQLYILDRAPLGIFSCGEVMEFCVSEFKVYLIISIPALSNVPSLSCFTDDFTKIPLRIVIFAVVVKGRNVWCHRLYQLRQCLTKSK